MPRRNGVYRRMRMLEVECLTVDTVKEKNSTETFLIPACLKADVLKSCKKLYESDTNIIVRVKQIVGEKYVNYFMNLFDFIKTSEVLEHEQEEK